MEPVPPLAEQHRQEIVTVLPGVLGQFRADHGRDGGEEIRQTDQLLARAAGREGRRRHGGLRARDDGRATVDDRAVWQLLADNVHLFALTPTGLWLRVHGFRVNGDVKKLDSEDAVVALGVMEVGSDGVLFSPTTAEALEHFDQTSVDDDLDTGELA